MNTQKMRVFVKGAESSVAQPRDSGLGLADMNLSELLNGAATTIVKDGRPLDLDMELIDEDPNQPRTEANPGFSDESLDEMAASIRLRGVKTPISVRVNLDQPGRFLINHGARRYRGSKRAGKTSIPSFIDNDYNKADQVVENLHRNELTAREIADYIGIELAKGFKKKEIADQISKSASFITQHATLLDLPDPIAKVFNAGRANDVTAVNELCTAYKKNPKEVTSWLENMGQEVTRDEVKLLREFLTEKRKNENEVENKIENENENETEIENENRAPDIVDAFSVKTDNNAEKIEQGFEAKKEKEVSPDKLKKTIVQVEHDGRPARLVLTRRPPVEGYGWIKYDDDGQEFESRLADVRLIALVEG